MTIEERIERLERTNRRYRFLFTLIGVLAVCAVGISATQDHDIPDVIQAKAFEVVDDERNVFVKLLESNGAGALGIFDKTGGILAAMASENVDGERAGVVTTLRKGQPLVGLDVTVVGHGGRIRVYGGDNEKYCLSLAADKNGDGRIDVSDRQGNRLFTLGARPTENGVQPFFGVMGANNNPVIWLGTSEDGQNGAMGFYGAKDYVVTIGATGNGGQINLKNKTGDVVCVLTVDEYGNGVISALDRNGKGRTLKPGP